MRQQILWRSALSKNAHRTPLPVTVARKFVYADDLPIMNSAEDWQSLEGTLHRTGNPIIVLTEMKAEAQYH